MCLLLMCLVLTPRKKGGWRFQSGSAWRTWSSPVPGDKAPLFVGLGTAGLRVRQTRRPITGCPKHRRTFLPCTRRGDGSRPLSCSRVLRPNDACGLFRSSPAWSRQRESRPQGRCPEALDYDSPEPPPRRKSLALRIPGSQGSRDQGPRTSSAC